MKKVVGLAILLFLLNICLLCLLAWYCQKYFDMFMAQMDEQSQAIRSMGVHISPHGYGVYPQVPAELPKRWEKRYGITTDADIWPRANPLTEILIRIEIKLLRQGEKVLDCIQSDGYIFPLYADTVYVKKQGDTGYHYVGTPAARKRFAKLLRDTSFEFVEADIPSDLCVISYEDGAIDPYNFLDIPRSAKLPWRTSK